jgi:hypothetical protein
MLNRTSDNVMGKPFFDIFPDAKGTLFEDKCRQAVRDKVFLLFEATFETPPYRGSYNVRVYPQEDGISVVLQFAPECRPEPGPGIKP